MFNEVHSQKEVDGTKISKGTLLNVAVDLAAHYCKNLQYNTSFLYYSKIL